ncbi:enoyl-(Acyl carrier protein) reductase domain-containing protein [Phthorimaea operculella]|nr:enoyl-(Acyl carrier protein) reductase domain-containing protein [Phthorimaea operculella]
MISSDIGTPIVSFTQSKLDTTRLFEFEIMSFNNKVVLVTGASSGIGAAAAILFAKEGANVSMVGRNQKKLDAVAEKVAAAGKAPLVINADVSKDDDAKRIITETVTKFGKMDVLVNNAGFVRYGSILDGKILESYDAIMSVNLRAVINLTTLAAPHLVSTKGNIVNISSAASFTTPKDSTFIAYYVSKHALDHFTRGAALELSSKGIRVNSVNPGPVETDFMENANTSVNWDDVKTITPLKRVSSPEEVAELISFLAGEKARGITGSCYLIDNGALFMKS